MSATIIGPPLPPELSTAARVEAIDERGFVARLVLAALFLSLGAWCALRPGWPLAAVGVLLIGLTFTHMVELQHQCLHHSAFRRAPLHRRVGILLGLPLLVSYTHYRLRHLQHHRGLGTIDDTEFFGFDPRGRLTVWLLLKQAFDGKRLIVVARHVLRAWSGRWKPEAGLSVPRHHASKAATEYRLIGACWVALICLAIAGGGNEVLRLWLLPLLVAIPAHFIVELPEHVFCDSGSTNVLRNTRSITGGRFSTWYTNGNNLHVEHHASMQTPLQRLRQRHSLVQQYGSNVQASYLDFFRLLGHKVQAAHAGGRNGS